MNDDNAMQQVGDELAYSLSQLIQLRIPKLAKQPESPIERAFLVGLMGQSYLTPCYDFGDDWSGFTVVRRGDRPIIKVELQAPVEGYRADFLFTVTVEEKVLGRVVVECDGHAFHERTKEQAARDRARDRAMTLAGYKVMRFTGREIHRNLMACVADAHHAAWHFFDGPAAA